MLRYETLELENNKYRVIINGKQLFFKENEWFNNVIVNTLNGEIEVSKNKLTEKQVVAFSKNMISDPTDYNGARQIYISKDGRYQTTLTVLKNKQYFNIKDLLKQDIQRLEVEIKELEMDMKQDKEEGIKDFLEEDTEKLNSLENELNNLIKSI